MTAPRVRLLRCLALLVLASFGFASGCAGSEFSVGSSTGNGGVSTGGANSSGGGSATTGGTRGSGGSSSKGDGGEPPGGAPANSSCQAPSDCNDHDPCTIDRCSGEGTCDFRPRCTAGEVCCRGVCGECCDESGCDDQVACTKDTCVAGACTHTPDDTACSETQYCSSTDDCRAKVPCQVDVDCDDGDPCTSEVCEGNQCVRSPCADGLTCCPGQGCAECCSDAQCHDQDACTRDSCVDGRCQRSQLCGAGLDCCLSADQQSATCGACCSASDCDDHVACTIDLCTTTGCAHVIDSTQCATSETCNAAIGCQRAAQCTEAGDCKSPVDSPCIEPACQNGLCSFPNCSAGEKCCQDGCRSCCSDTDCADAYDCTVDRCVAGTCQNEPSNDRCSGGFECRPSAGGCVECTSSGECDDENPCTTDRCESNRCTHVNTCAARGQLCCGNACAACCTDYDCVPNPLPAPAGKVCQSYACEAGKCVTKSATCAVTTSCCPVGGCTLLGLCKSGG